MLDPLELDLQMAVSHHLGAGNPAQIHYKSSQYSEHRAISPAPTIRPFEDIPTSSHQAKHGLHTHLISRRHTPNIHPEGLVGRKPLRSREKGDKLEQSKQEGGPTRDAHCGALLAGQAVWLGVYV